MYPRRPAIFASCSLLAIALAVGPRSFADEPSANDLSASDALKFVKTYCFDCHQGKKPEAKLDLAKFDSAESIVADVKTWSKVLRRVQAGEMPPADAEAPPKAQREQFAAWLNRTVRDALCGDGPPPGPAPLRRLNRTQYAATVRDLLGIQVNMTSALPEDGSGGEGFDNAAETLSLSPLHVEKYLEAAKQALDYAVKDPRTRATLLNVQPTSRITPEAAARRILQAFLPRAFRRPASEDEVAHYVALFQSATDRGAPYDEAVLYALQGVLISPQFLFLLETPNTDAKQQLVSDFELASRLSYFLWNSMPDDALTKLAAAGKLHEPATLDEQVARMIKDRKALVFVESFAEQWLGTRDLGRTIKPDRVANRSYDNELEWAIKMEPVLFLQEILVENRPLPDLLNANYTYLNDKLSKHYKLTIAGLGQQMKRTDLPADSHRGGVLGMAAVLTVSSHPDRTSPVLRGKWVLETLLGTPPAPPPPNVPELKTKGDDGRPKTVREALLIHRENAVCASCHNRIDPIGFGLENYDVLGRWRTQDAGKAIDASGELPDGTKFAGPDGLVDILLMRKDEFVRHVTTKMLGYALGRGLTLSDQCTVDDIAQKVKASGYKSHVLLTEIVRSTPFRYRAGHASESQQVNPSPDKGEPKMERGSDQKE